MTVTFLKDYFDDTLKHPHWFNGRILTGTDLREEQAAHLQRSRYLAQTLGSGVVSGLDVSGDSRTVTVTPGLAISEAGDVLHLPAETSLDLITGNTPPPVGQNSIFVPCDIGGITSLNNISSDYYILTLTSASKPSNTLAPTSALDGKGDQSCIYKYHEVGVQFKLIGLGGFYLPDNEGDKTIRNEIAHLCYGSYMFKDMATTPMEVPARYGLLNRLRDANRLLACDVPLAMLHFHNASVQFVDVWAVRRPVYPAQQLGAYPVTFGPADIGENFTQFSSPRRMVEGTVMLLQFQTQLNDLANERNGQTLKAKDHFIFLPPAGYLPIGNGNREFKIDQFFSGIGFRQPESKLDPAFLRQIFHQSNFVDAIDLSTDSVDLFAVEGAPNNYRIFVRQQQITLVDPSPPDEDEEEPAGSKGSLTITLLTKDGIPFNPPNLSSILVSARKGGKIYRATKVSSRGKPVCSPRWNKHIRHILLKRQKRPIKNTQKMSWMHLIQEDQASSKV